jgi:uncharacterized protein DUF4239
VQTLIEGVLIVGGSVLVSLAGMAWVRRKVPHQVLREQNEVAGFIIAVLGVAYAVLLAFVIFTVWNRFEEARVVSAQEANALTNAFRVAEGFPDPARRRMLDLCRLYARNVVEEEWELTGRGMQSQDSPRAWTYLNQLWTAVRDTAPHTPREQALYAQLLTEMHDLGNQRKLRLLASREGIPSVMWVVLVSGGVLTVAFTYFFGIKSSRTQALMTAALAGTIALNLYLIEAIDYPFTGDVQVHPEAFHQALRVFDQQEGTAASGR